MDAGGLIRTARGRASAARLAPWFALAALSAATATAAFEAVPAPPASAVVLQWQPAPADGRRPVVVALHGCGGLYTVRGRLDVRYLEYAERWNAAGWHVLLPDSFSARGQQSICREPGPRRSITVAMRRSDVNAALEWLAQRPDVDPQRIALVGWSNGGSTVLRTIDRPAWSLAPAAAVAFYPGCAASLGRHDWSAAVPLLMLVGERDDWTPPQPCTDLARRTTERRRGAAIEFISYPGSYHGFDSSGPVRWLAGIPNGVDGTGVHAGGNADARADALQRTDRFLRRFLD